MMKIRSLLLRDRKFYNMEAWNRKRNRGWQEAVKEEVHWPKMLSKQELQQETSTSPQVKVLLDYTNSCYFHHLFSVPNSRKTLLVIFYVFCKYIFTIRLFCHKETMCFRRKIVICKFFLTFCVIQKSSQHQEFCQMETIHFQR